MYASMPRLSGYSPMIPSARAMASGTGIGPRTIADVTLNNASSVSYEAWARPA